MLNRHNGKGTPEQASHIGELWVRLGGPASTKSAEKGQRKKTPDFSLGSPHTCAASTLSHPCKVGTSTCTHHTHVEGKKWKRQEGPAEALGPAALPAKLSPFSVLSLGMWWPQRSLAAHSDFTWPRALIWRLVNRIWWVSQLACGRSCLGRHWLSSSESPPQNQA